ncbi:MAG: dienelactone hydrolase family protein [Candidatus Kariarchaeaceae archaeon]|jgi:carboxymethylenebutenolidase
MGKFVSIRSNPPLPVYLSVPEGEGVFPAVILFMHRPGLDKPQQQVCDDLAKAGYVTLGADAYRDGHLNQDTYTDQSIFEDFEVTLGYTKNLENVDSSRIGVIGFCMGGRHAYLAGVRYRGLKAVVSYYGFPTRGNDTTDTPIDLVMDMKIPVLGIFGETDPMIPMDDVNAFKEQLLSVSDKHCIKVFDGVGHGFLNPGSPRHEPEAAAAAWLVTLEHYRKFL